jgi:hypothetical protein
MNFSLTESNNSRSMQVKKAKTKVLKDCDSDAVKKATMLIIVQQSVKRILPSHDGLYRFKCGENGHLASWCAKEDDNQPQDRSLNTLTSSQTYNRQNTKARKTCFYCNKEGHFIS